MIDFIQGYDKLATAVRATGLDLIIDVSQRRTSYNDGPDFAVFYGPKVGESKPLFYKSGTDLDALVEDAITSLGKFMQEAK